MAPRRTKKLAGGSLMDNQYMKYMPLAGPIYNAGLKEVTDPVAVSNTSRVPSTKVIYKMLDNSYKESREEVDGWRPILVTNTLIAYANNSETICIALRGTDMRKSADLAADIQIAFNDLRNSGRFKEDVALIRELQKKFPPSQYYYIGLGHSLSGALIDELLDDGLIREAVSFNPAVQKKHYNTPTKNRRIYYVNDPLHQLLGRWVKYREVRKTDIPIEKAHSLDNFVGGGSLEGAGVLDWLKSAKDKVVGFFSPRLDDYSNKSKDTLQKYGNTPIQSLQIYRTPISGLIDKALNLISFGKWADLKKQYGFDRLFHLALVANIGNKNIVIEKNEVVNISTEYKTSGDTEVFNIDIGAKRGPSFTVYNLVNDTRKRIGDQRFFSYDAFTNNCQYFIRYILETAGLYTGAAEKFLFQDISEIYKRLPSYVSKIARAVTDTGAVVSKITGRGDDDADSICSDCEDDFEEDLIGGAARLTKPALYEVCLAAGLPARRADKKEVLLERLSGGLANRNNYMRFLIKDIIQSRPRSRTTVPFVKTPKDEEGKAIVPEYHKLWYALDKYSVNMMDDQRELFDGLLDLKVKRDTLQDKMESFTSPKKLANAVGQSDRLDARMQKIKEELRENNRRLDLVHTKMEELNDLIKSKSNSKSALTPTIAKKFIAASKRKNRTEIEILNAINKF
jgi:hypothetical protein